MGVNEEYYKEKRRSIMRYLAELAKEKGLSQYEIAERTGFKQNNVSRMFAGQYSPSLDNLLRLAEAIGYDVAIINKGVDTSPVDDQMIEPKFMLVVDHENNELYILHRQYPSCLIQVVQETPMRFVIQDLYDDMDNPADILNMSFVEEAKEYFRKYAEEMDNN